MEAAVAQQTSIGDQLKAQIAEAFFSPVTEAIKVIRVAALFGIDARQTSIDKLGELKEEIFKKAAELWEPVAKKAVSDLTQEDLKILREASEKLEALKGINGNSVDALGATVSNNFATKVDGNTFRFHIAGPATPKSQESYVRGKLGDNAQVFIDGLKSIGVDVALDAPTQNTATLRTDSNNKNRSEQIRLYGSNDLIDPAQGANLAIEAVCIAQKAGIDLTTIKDAKSGKDESYEAKGARIKALALEKGLDEGTASMLEKLTSGVIRVGGSGSGALDVNDDGRLCAGVCAGGRGAPGGWAIGAGSASE